MLESLNCTVHSPSNTTAGFNETIGYSGESEIVQKVTVVLAYIIAAIFTVFENTVVLIIYRKTTAIRKLPFNLYIANLAFADLLVGLLVTPGIGIRNNVPYELGVTSIIIYEWLIRFPVFLSIFIVVAMTFDRYLLVSDPLLYTVQNTHSIARRRLTVTWVISFIYSCFYSVVNQVTVQVLAPSTSDSNLTIARVTSSARVLLDFILPFVILLSVNVLFLIKLNLTLKTISLQLHDEEANSSRTYSHYHTETTQTETAVDDKLDYNLKTSSGTDRTRDGDVAVITSTGPSSVVLSIKGQTRRGQIINDSRLRKVARNLMLLVSVFLICWLPLNFLMLFKFVVTVDWFFLSVALIILLFNSAINPWLYAIMNKHYRSGMAKLFYCSKQSL
ncbi:putative octopamine receptor beta-1R-like [Apostichopus japonicus]|uniref:Putative octopamine receptor beta-1R-like n=1 Tax=Stichopus japonicus TaxID=307972 RepID=A0A2G8KLX8_STIJA|nr:putative octopamine receptor beta-1R-like [Apostichopus japonicus]